MLYCIILMQYCIILMGILVYATTFAYTIEPHCFSRGRLILMYLRITPMHLCIKSIFSLSFPRLLKGTDPNITGFLFED